MEIWYYALGAFTLGVPAAWAWGRWAICVQERLPIHAAAWDAIIVVLGTVGTLTLWSAADDSMWVLLASTFGHAAGTYLVVSKQKTVDKPRPPVV